MAAPSGVVSFVCVFHQYICPDCGSRTSCHGSTGAGGGGPSVAAGGGAPSSGEGIYYAMVGGRVAATACAATLASGRVKDLKLARKLFMREHKTVVRVLASMQNAYYRSDDRRERFVSLCHDIDVQRLTFEAYMNKKLVKARPMAHVKIGIKNLAHLTGLVKAEHV